MCQFFSCVSNGQGNLFYFDWKMRKELLKSNPEHYEPDSHTSVAHKFNLNGDKVNKYEYNPLTKEFIVDQINIKDDRALVKRKLDNMDWKTIIEPLIVKPIINPLTDVKEKKVTKKDINNLKKWSSVRDSVGAFVGDSVGVFVGASVGDSVGVFVGVFVGASVGDSVWDSVWASVGDSVWDSVGASVEDSVWDSVGAYISSFFDIKYEYDFKPSIELWERGFVPSFDGKIWRLHQGKDAKIVFKIEK